jgi:urea transporter
MQLNDIVAMAFNGASAKLRRRALAYSICAVGALGATILASSAAILALEPEVGSIGARLIVTGFFVLIIPVAVVWLHMSRSPAATPPAGRSEASNQQAQFAQLAMIVEAVLLGYSLSRRSGRR